MKIKNYLLIALIAFSFAACKKDKDDNTDQPTKPYQSGVFISCEGPFQTGTGTVSFFDRTTSAVTNDIFETVNHRPLGNVVQSISIYNDKAYIPVNNAGKVEVVTYDDFVSVATITGFDKPRYFTGFNSSKAYVSDMTGYIAVVNLSTNTISKKIQNGRSPDNMVVSDDKLFVLNFGGYGTDSTISVVNTLVDTLQGTIMVKYKPNSIKIDANGKLWVMCGGKGFTGYPQADDTEGHLLRIDPETYAIELDIAFPSTTDHPEHMVFNTNNTKAYYINNNMIYQYDIGSASLNTTPLINKSFYTIGYDNVSGYIFAGDPVDYSQEGWVFRYNATTGSKVDSIKVGVIPGNFEFK